MFFVDLRSTRFALYQLQEVATSSLFKVMMESLPLMLMINHSSVAIATLCYISSFRMLCIEIALKRRQIDQGTTLLL